MANRLSFSGEQWWNAVSRNAFAGAKMYTYTAQSRTVDKTTWTDGSEATPHANPIVADANGIFPEIYGSGVYFIDIYSSDDATLIYQADSIYPTAIASGGTTMAVANLIADLQAVDTSAFQYAKVLGSTVIDDGGQAEYYYSSGSTATPNNTTVVQPDVGTGRWLILNTETLALGDSSVTTTKILDKAVNKAKRDWMPFASKDGMAVSNNSSDAVSDIDISVGEIMDSSDTYLIRLEEARIKQINTAYAVSTDATATGGFSDQSTLSTNAWYGVFALSKSSDTTDTDIIIASSQSDALSDTVASAHGFDIARFVEPIYRNATPTILPFLDDGNGNRVYDVAINEGISKSTSGASITVTAPPFMRGHFTYTLYGTGSTLEALGLLTQTAQTNTAPTRNGVHDIYYGGGSTTDVGSSVQKTVKVDGSRQLRHYEVELNDTVIPELISLGYEMDLNVTDMV